MIRCPQHDRPDCSPLLNGCSWRPDVPYERTVLVGVLVAHQPTSSSGCICGWAELGRSHPVHVVAEYEAAVGR